MQLRNEASQLMNLQLFELDAAWRSGNLRRHARQRPQITPIGFQRVRRYPALVSELIEITQHNRRHGFSRRRGGWLTFRRRQRHRSLQPVDQTLMQRPMAADTRSPSRSRYSVPISL